MNERRFKVINIALVVSGAIFLFLSGIKIGSQEVYKWYSLGGFILPVASIVWCIMFYSKKYNIYEMYVYIPIVLVLAPILNIGFNNKYTVLVITLAVIILIGVATFIIIHKEKAEICKTICSSWKLSLSIIIFSIAMIRFIGDTLGITTSIDSKIFYASSAIFCEFKFCIYLMDRKK